MIILQSIPCLLNQKITVFIREHVSPRFEKNLPPMSFDFPVLIKVGFNVDTKIVIVIDASGSFSYNKILPQICRFALENEEFMSMDFSFSCSNSSGDSSSNSSGDSSGGSNIVHGIKFMDNELFLEAIAGVLSANESRVIFLFQDEASAYRFQSGSEYLDRGLEVLQSAYSTSAPSYVRIFAVGTGMVKELSYAWSKSPIEGSGWTWGVYGYKDDFFTLLSKQFTSVFNNQKSLAFSIPILLKNLDLETILGEKPYVIRIWGLDWEYLAELRADENNSLLENTLIPPLLYGVPIYEHNSRHPLTVTHLCGDYCCPPGCCLIKVRDQFCCVKSI